MDNCFFETNWITIKKTKKNIERKKIIEETKKGDVYKKVLDIFSDAELVDIKLKDNDND